MWKQKSIVLLICGCGFLAAGLGASVEPGGGPITIPLFSYNANCFLTTVGCGFKVAKVTDSFHDPVCGFQLEVDLASSEALTATGATLSESADWTGGCQDGINPPADCDERWAKSNADVDVDWSIKATTTDITVFTDSSSASTVSGLTAQAKIGPGGGLAPLIGAQASWKIPNGNDTFEFEVPFTISSSTTKIHIDTEQVHSSRFGSWTNDEASMIWRLYRDVDGDCDYDDPGDSLVTGPHSTSADDNDGTVHGSKEGTDIDLPSGVDSFVLVVVMKTNNSAVVFIGGCGARARQGGTFTTWSKLVIEPTS